MSEAPKNSEPFLVQWKDGKLVKVEDAAPLAHLCGHPTATKRTCPVQGHECSCCQRCFSECALGDDDDEEWH